MKLLILSIGIVTLTQAMEGVLETPYDLIMNEISTNMSPDTCCPGSSWLGCPC